MYPQPRTFRSVAVGWSLVDATRQSCNFILVSLVFYGHFFFVLIFFFNVVRCPKRLRLLLPIDSRDPRTKMSRALSFEKQSTVLLWLAQRRARGQRRRNILYRAMGKSWSAALSKTKGRYPAARASLCRRSRLISHSAGLTLCQPLDKDWILWT